MIHVFVYGTLLPGECNHSLAASYLMDSKHGCVHGCLYDAGGYPGIVLGGIHLVLGRWLLLKDEALPVLDELEDYHGEGSADNDYERVWVTDARNPSQSGWVYSWVDSRDLPVIPTGNWLSRNL